MPEKTWKQAKYWEIGTRDDVLFPKLSSRREVMLQAQREHLPQLAYARNLASEVLDDYGVVGAVRTIYLAFAEEIYRIKQQISGKASQIEVEAVAIKYCLYGCDPEIIQSIANIFGYKVFEIAREKLTWLMSEDIVYRGTKKALQETLHMIDVNLVDKTYEYDPTTGNLIKITGKDIITGKTKIIHFEWDTEGNLKRVWEEWV